MHLFTHHIGSMDKTEAVTFIRKATQRFRLVYKEDMQSHEIDQPYLEYGNAGLVDLVCDMDNPKHLHLAIHIHAYFDGYKAATN